MKKSTGVYLLLCIVACTLACIVSCQNSEQKKKDQDQVNKPKEDIPKKSEKKEVPEVPPATDTIKAKTNNSPKVRTKKEPKIEIIPNTKSKDSNLTFQTPQQADWYDYYSSRKDWMELFEDGKTYYLKSVQKALDSKPSLQITQDKIMKGYNDKLSKTFYENPQFIQFCNQKFKDSKELNDFLLLNKSRMTVSQ